MINREGWNESGRKIGKRRKRRGAKEFVRGAEKGEGATKRNGSRSVHNLIESLFSKETEKNEGTEARKRRRRWPKVRWTLVKFGRWFLLSFLIGQDLVRINAALDDVQYRSGRMTRMQEEVKASSWGASDHNDATTGRLSGQNRNAGGIENGNVYFIERICVEALYMIIYRGTSDIVFEVNTE